MQILLIAKIIIYIKLKIGIFILSRRNGASIFIYSDAITLKDETA